jgi:type IV pilus assembly protein PilO
MTMPQFLDPIVTLPKPYKLLLGGLGVVVIAVAAWILLLSPVRDRIAALETQRQGLEREVAQNRAVLAQLEIVRRQAQEIERKLAVLTEKLPTEKEIPPLYRSVSDAASRSGLAVSLFQPKDSRIYDFYSEIPISVTAEAGYHHFAQFFDRLTVLPRLIAVGDWKLTGLGKSQSPIRGELTLATYSYRPVGSPPAPKPGAK